MGYAATGAQDLTRITLDGLRSNAAKATGTVKFNGNLNSTAATGATVAETTLNSVVVDDALGGLHTLKLDIKNNGTAAPNTWTVTVTDSTGAAVGSGTIGFVGGAPDPTQDTVTVNYTPSGGAAFRGHPGLLHGRDLVRRRQPVVVGRGVAGRLRRGVDQRDDVRQRRQAEHHVLQRSDGQRRAARACTLRFQPRPHAGSGRPVRGRRLEHRPPRPPRHVRPGGRSRPARSRCPTSTCRASSAISS